MHAGRAHALINQYRPLCMRVWRQRPQRVARLVLSGVAPAVLQASAADNGQCLVHDVTAFKSNGIVDGLVNNVSAANVSESDTAPDPVKALVWHGASLLLVGTEQGELGDGVWTAAFARGTCRVPITP